MKLTDAKKVADLVERLKAKQAELKTFREEPLMLAFGNEETPRRDWVVLMMAAAPAEDLRGRVITAAIMEIEKIKEALAALGVEV